MTAKRLVRDPSGAWIAVPGRRKGLPSPIWLPILGRTPGSPSSELGRDARGRFARLRRPPEAHWALAQGRVTYWRDGYRLDGKRVSDSGGAKEVRRILRRGLPRRPHWRFYLRSVTYHREEGKGGITFFRVNGRRVSPAVAQWKIACLLLESIPASFKSDVLPDAEDADDPQAEERSEFEVNDCDLSLEDVQGAYEMAGAEKGGNDTEEDVEPEVSFSGETVKRLEALRAWELALRESPFGRWSLRDKKIGCALSYYVVAHKLVYADRAKFGEVVRTRYAPVSREAWLELVDRMEKAANKTDEDVEWTVGGFFFMLKVLT